MNIEEYISNGVIEAYVLGIATVEEVQEIERYALEFPEIKALILEQESALAAYAEAQSLAPAPHLKQQIWDKLKDLEAEPQEQAAPTPKIALARPQSKPSTWKSYAMAASVSLLLVSAAANIVMLQKQHHMSEDLNSMLATQKTMIADKEAVEQHAQAADEALAVMSLPELKKIQLSGVGTHAESSAMLYWDAATGNVFLNLNSMPDAPTGKEYQLWAIIDGQPVDAGMYHNQTGATLLQMKTIAKAEMFAITIENAGGSPSPTLDQMVVAGKTS